MRCSMLRALMEFSFVGRWWLEKFINIQIFTKWFENMKTSCCIQFDRRHDLKINQTHVDPDRITPRTLQKLFFGILYLSAGTNDMNNSV